MQNAPDADGDIIHTVDKPFSADGGIAVLKGNLAEDGAVVKKGAVAPEMMQHKGPAKCYNSEERKLLLQLTAARLLQVMLLLFVTKVQRAVPV